MLKTQDQSIMEGLLMNDNEITVSKTESDIDTIYAAVEVVNSTANLETKIDANQLLQNVLSKLNKEYADKRIKEERKQNITTVKK